MTEEQRKTLNVIFQLSVGTASLPDGWNVDVDVESRPGEQCRRVTITGPWQETR